MILGIMQGRLVPPEGGSIQAFPRDRWAEEFPRAADAGLDAIEWIYDGHGEDVNPLANDAGIREMKNLAVRHGVAVRSVCADYFMEKPLVRADGDASRRFEKLVWVLDRARSVGAGRVVLPFVDNSALRTAADEDEAVRVLERALPNAERTGVEMHLETALGPEDFTRLLARLDHPLIRVNYDSGNSASLGFAPAEEFAAYGARVGSVHIKDRRRGGGTVPLGTGDADLPALFHALRERAYGGDFVLQVARGAPGEEVAWARANRESVRRLWDEAGRESDGSRA
jgi:hexulose-6-phosphate isomerase